MRLGLPFDHRAGVRDCLPAKRALGSHHPFHGSLYRLVRLSSIPIFPHPFGQPPVHADMCSPLLSIVASPLPSPPLQHPISTASTPPRSATNHSSSTSSALKTRPSSPSIAYRSILLPRRTRSDRTHLGRMLLLSIPFVAFSSPLAHRSSDERGRAYTRPLLASCRRRWSSASARQTRPSGSSRQRSKRVLGSLLRDRVFASLSSSFPPGSFLFRASLVFVSLHLCVLIAFQLSCVHSSSAYLPPHV
jgi:hypothetical protein